VIQLLINAGADVKVKDRVGFTPLHYYTDVEMINLLIEAGADVNARDNTTMRTPIYLQTNPDVIRLYVEKGVNLNSKDHLGWSVLYYQTTVENVKLLIELGADVNIRDDSGVTPLYVIKNPTAIRALIEAGANLKNENIHGRTPVDCNSVVFGVVEDMACETLVRFVKNCKWFRLLKLTKTFAFNKWYCGEEDGNGGGTGRKVDHKRIMDTFVKM